ncbi:hypothetical protein HPB49_009933 [Dermacentor silvarum]|uniref:Uncharacterized protein n=1 Tax=Dermacentor silvarum TaxID=543639 RepID=A0ACB8DII5_DERSI|nr:hypothetical protein HPB49_009933 [Dermacentor silvarum]
MGSFHWALPPGRLCFRAFDVSRETDIACRWPSTAVRMSCLAAGSRDLLTAVTMTPISYPRVFSSRRHQDTFIQERVLHFVDGQRDRADRDRALGHHSQRCCSPPFVVVAQADGEPPRKRQRTSEDFISFCKFILEYENYESIKQEELQEKDAVSPSDSSADSVDSVKQEDSEQVGKTLGCPAAPPERATVQPAMSHVLLMQSDGLLAEHIRGMGCHVLDACTLNPSLSGKWAVQSPDRDICVACRRRGLLVRGYHAGGRRLSRPDHLLLPEAVCRRPMIECSECLTWIHLSCAKIRRNNIPDEFTCQRCREAKHTTRRSQRIRAGGTTPPQRRRPST